MDTIVVPKSEQEWQGLLVGCHNGTHLIQFSMDCHGLVSRNAIKTALRSLAKGEPLPLAMGDPSSALSNPAVPASLPDCDGFQHQVAEMAPAMPLSALDLPHGSGKLPPDSLQAGPVPVGLPLGGTWHQRIYFAQTATFLSGADPIPGQASPCSQVASCCPAKGTPDCHSSAYAAKAYQKTAH